MSDPNAPQQPSYDAAPQYPSAPQYGAPAPAYGGAPAPVPGKTLGIVGLILSCIFFVPLSVLVGLILSIVALVQSRKAGVKNGPAVAGIIISAVLIVIGIIVGVIIGVSVASIVGTCAELGPGVHEVGGVTFTCG